MKPFFVFAVWMNKAARAHCDAFGLKKLTKTANSHTQIHTKGRGSFPKAHTHSHTVQNAHVALCACESIYVWRHFHKQPKKQFAFFRWLLWLFNNFCVYMVYCCCLVRRLNKFFRFLFAYFSQSSISFSPNNASLSALDYVYLYFCSCIRIWICTCSCLRQSFHIYSFSLRFHCGFGVGFGFGSSHSFLIKCINQNDRLPSNVGYKKQKNIIFATITKQEEKNQKCHSFIFMYLLIFPAGDKLLRGKPSQLFHYDFFFNCIEFELRWKCGSIAPKYPQKSRPSPEN